MFIFLQKCKIIHVFRVPGGKQLLPLVSGLGSEKAVQVLGYAWEGVVSQHIALGPGAHPTAGSSATSSHPRVPLLLSPFRGAREPYRLQD